MYHDSEDPLGLKESKKETNSTHFTFVWNSMYIVERYIRTKFDQLTMRLRDGVNFK